MISAADTLATNHVVRVWLKGLPSGCILLKSSRQDPCPSPILSCLMQWPPLKEQAVAGALVVQHRTLIYHLMLKKNYLR